MYITSIFNRRSLLKQLYFYNIYDECLLLFPNSKFSVNISHKEEMIYIRLRKTNSKFVRITRSSIDDTSSWHCKIYQKIDYQYGRSCFAHADFFVNLNHTDLKALLLRISETDNINQLNCSGHLFVRRKQRSKRGVDYDLENHSNLIQSFKSYKRNAINHSKINPFYIYTGKNRKYVISKKADIDLFSHISELKRWNISDTFNLFSSLLEASILLANMNFTHIDLHQGNILVTTSEKGRRFTLCDFGNLVSFGKRKAVYKLQKYNGSNKLNLSLHAAPDIYYDAMINEQTGLWGAAYITITSALGENSNTFSIALHNILSTYFTTKNKSNAQKRINELVHKTQIPLLSDCKEFKNLLCDMLQIDPIERRKTGIIIFSKILAIYITKPRISQYLLDEEIMKEIINIQDKENKLIFALRRVHDFSHISQRLYEEILNQLALDIIENNLCSQVLCSYNQLIINQRHNKKRSILSSSDHTVPIDAVEILIIFITRHLDKKLNATNLCLNDIIPASLLIDSKIEIVNRFIRIIEAIKFKKIHPVSFWQSLKTSKIWGNDQETINILDAKYPMDDFQTKSPRPSI